MDRINGATTVDIGSGRRGFRDEDLVLGVRGTVVSAAFLNALQEEILRVIEESGMSADAADWTQLARAIRRNSILVGRYWLVVMSATTVAPPSAPATGDVYIVPTAATDAWAGKSGQVAWALGSGWIFTTPPAGTIASVSDTGKYLRRDAAGWAEWIATVDRAGIIELATIAETQTGTDPQRAVTPAGLSARTATATRTGLVSLNDLDARYSRLVPPPADTFYVVGASGNDANTGLSTGTGFRTIRGAIDAINSRYSALGLINLIVSAGTFDGFPVPLNGNKLWRIKGAGRTSTFISATSTSVNSGRACSVAGASVILEDLSLAAYYECADIGPEGGMLEIVSCNFALGGASSVGINATAGQISVYGNVQFSGAGRACILSSSLIRLGYADEVTTRVAALVWAAGCTVSDANIVSTDGGRVRVFPAAFQQSGAPTGKKYSARLNGIINTSGGSVVTIAGTLAGTTETGGQYV